MESTSPFRFEPNSEQLDLITELAFDLLSWKDISYFLNVDPEIFKMTFDNERSSLFLAYQSGRVKRKHELRKPILQMATQGSPQAEMLALKFLDEQYNDEINE
jgi:hypothetical protein